MTATELSAHIGQSATLMLRTPRLDIHDLDVDAKMSYGAVRYAVDPIAGTGRVWVSAENVTVGHVTEGR